MASGRYLLEGRLEDVILLIQFLAPNSAGQLSHTTIHKELGVGPSTPGYTSWADVAGEHPEFFRVSGTTSEYKEVSLLAKFAGRKTKSGDDHPPPKVVAALIDVAMKLAERQEKAEERKRAYLPLLTALMGGVFTLAAVLLSRWVG